MNIRRAIMPLRGGALLASAALAGTVLAGPVLAGTGARAGAVAGGDLTVVAGGVGGPADAPNVTLIGPYGVTFSHGRLYVAAQEVRAINPRSGWLTTPAGDEGLLPFADGGLATRANLDAVGVAMDGAGNEVIADSDDGAIRVVAAHTGTFFGQAMTAGHIYRIAGHGTGDASGVPGNDTGVNPMGLAVDAAGNAVIADTYDNLIRVVAARSGTYYGQAMTAGDIYTVAGTGKQGYSGNGGPATAARLFQPWGVAVDSAGNLIVADTFDSVIQVVAARTGTYYGKAMTAGDLYRIAGNGRRGFTGDGGPAGKAELYIPQGVSTDRWGNVLVADTFNNVVRVVAARTGTFYGQPMRAGRIYTVAGTGTGGFTGDRGPATAAELDSPAGVGTDSAGNLVIADTGNGRIRVVAARTGRFYGLAMTAGDIYAVAGNSQLGQVSGQFSGNGGPATHAQAAPAGVALDPAGDLLLADVANHRIRLVPAASGTYFGQAMTAGHIYTVAGDGVPGYRGDGGPARQARLDNPAGVAVDGAGNLVVADTYNNVVRVVAAHSGTFYGQAMTAGDIYTVAGTGMPGYSGDGVPASTAELDNPDGVAVDGAGNLVVADTDNNVVRVVAARDGTFYGVPMTAGDIYTVAGTGVPGYSGDGGPARQAGLTTPGDVALDGAGNLVIADSGDGAIRVVAASDGTFYGQAMTAGDIYTVAGGTAVPIEGSDAVAVDAAGNLVTASRSGNVVQVLAARTGTFYGVPMTAGDVYTVAGTGQNGFTGDHGPALRTDLAGPDGLATDGAGTLIISDTGNARVDRLPMG